MTNLILPPIDQYANKVEDINGRVIGYIDTAHWSVDTAYLSNVQKDGTMKESTKHGEEPHFKLTLILRLTELPLIHDGINNVKAIAEKTFLPININE